MSKISEGIISKENKMFQTSLHTVIIKEQTTVMWSAVPRMRYKYSSLNNATQRLKIKLKSEMCPPLVLNGTLVVDVLLVL